MDADFRQTKEHFLTYNPASSCTEYVDAEGIYYYDSTGKRYMCLNEISLSMGLKHPEFTRRVSELVLTKMLAHGGSVSKDKEQMIETMMRYTHGHFDKLFLAASGGEVVDWALKIARRYTGRDGIVSFQNALHGRSFAGAYISGTPLRKEGFGSGLSNVSFLEYPGDGRSSDYALADISDVAAVIIEPYQAIGGMVSPSKEYWRWLRDYTRDQGILLIIDEIQTGYGKTGSMFAYEESGIVPDILLLGKGMSNGFGLGGLLMTEEVGSHLKPNELSGGSADNDFMCSVINLVFELFEKEQIVAHVAEVGDYAMKQFKEFFHARQMICDIHGKGLFFSMNLPDGVAEQIASACREEGILFGRSGNRLMMRPPLIITKEEIDQVIAVMGKILE